MEKLLQEQRLAMAGYQVTSVSANKRQAGVTELKVEDTNPFCRTFRTEVLENRDVTTGMKVHCTCNRHLQGILCDHVAAHVESVGLWQLETLVHPRNSGKHYKSQYPSNLPLYPSPNFNDLVGDKRLRMPVVKFPRRGRSRKARFISSREQGIQRAKKKRKLELSKP